ncbi:MAG TPA: hypothetical protein VG456_25750 [Candidatus Sulfopaludibacter sp.]|nr:hypothetical protein [Candidatus Sulfopaludibacter sp.]
MKYFRKAAWVGRCWQAKVAALLCLVAVGLRGELSPYLQHSGSESGLRAVFFGDARRTPRETRAELTRRIALTPKDTTLYRLRASEAELSLDFAAAESDWKMAGDPTALADFYHRRLRPVDEIAVLDAIATPEAFQRAIDEAAAQGLPVAPQYRAWIAHDPGNAALHKRFLRYLIEHRDFAAAETELRALPADPANWLEEMNLELRRGSVDRAIAVFDKSFQPAMETAGLKEFFDLLKNEGRLSDFALQARTAAQAHPESLDPVARLFHYYETEQNHAAARRVLAEYQERQQHWTPAELYDTAQLLQRVQEWDQAARQYYALYTLSGAAPADRERGMAGLAGLLLTAPEQPIQFGAGDLSLYKDIGGMDPNPGFLNGILSLVLNSSSPRREYGQLTSSATAYFHRARAAELLQVFDAQFPHAAEAPGLHAQLIEAYAFYAENDGVIRAGRAFLGAYPRAPERVRVALLMADAYARQDKTADEFAVYDQLLKETREKEYLNILDRYVARLVAMRRAADALEIYRHEIDRNPNDPALYEKFAAFLDQRNLTAQVEAVYKSAAAQFRGSAWDQKLARWYLRQQRTRDFEELTARVAQIFSGSDLESYVGDVAPRAIDPALYLRVNLYAHQRFPDDMAFVRNLLFAYSRTETSNPAQYTQLLRAYWFYDPQMRTWFFEALSRTGRLDAELAAVRRSGATSPAAVQFLAEGEAWRSHFESAAAPFRTLAADFPGSTDVVLRASTVERSLGHTETALATARNLIQSDPRDREALARAGDTLADRDLFTRARPFWERMAQIEPGKPEGYLEAATVFWDYYKFDDALRLISQARTRLRQPNLFAYEAGAIYEGKRDESAAVKEYVKGDEKAQARLIHLSQTASHRAAVDAVMPAASLETRVAILRAEKRLNELQVFLSARAGGTSSVADLEVIQQTAAEEGFVALEQLALERQVAIQRDPLERIRLRLALMRLQETRNDVPAARRTIEALYGENPAVLGVVRATTDFYWRHKLSTEAVATLTQAASTSNAAYRVQFTYEAARKATEAGRFDEARRLLASLLQAQPFDGQYLAAMADTYARANDDQGLRDFYRAAIEAMKQAPLADGDRNDRIGGLRRGLIPALARLGRQWDAVDQYIQLINHYPEDQGLIREAARFASRNNLAPRLAAYYTKACSESPKDYRWPMVLGHLQQHFENFDAAIAAYTAASVVRPDRIDFYQNRAELEERLLRFADAEKTYRTVWDLSYRNATWLEKVAELEARQSKAEEAVATLRKAWLEDRPERADTLLEIAGRLESWGLVKQAGDFATRAAQYGLKDEDTATYARVLTRLRRYDEVLSNLPDNDAALNAMARTVAEDFSPEEKSAFEAALEKQAGATPEPRWNRIAHTAGIYDLEVRWLGLQQARSPYMNGEIYNLQSRRMRYAELARMLERNPEFLMQAAGAYAMAGDAEGLNGVLARMPQNQRPWAQQYWRTIAQGDPWKLLPFAATRNDAVDLALESGDVKLALAAVAARGRSMPPLWTNAYTALTSLYYINAAPDATSLFQTVLGPRNIGEALGPVDRNRRLAGSAWFYYGSRFGEYLAYKNQAASGDYLPAALEADPANAHAYADLADWYAERGDTARALTGYGQALELDPGSGAPHDRMAVVLWQQGRKDEAVAQWKAALAAFEAQQGRPNLQGDFWVNAPAAIEHIGERNLAAELGPSVDSLLRAYAARHGEYRGGSLVMSAAKYHLIDFSRQPIEVLQELSRNALPVAERIAILRRILYLLPKNDRWQVQSTQRELAGLLLQSGDIAGAQALSRHEWADIELRIAWKTGRLDARFLETFPVRELESAAREFSSSHEDDLADPILEWVYTRSLDQGDFDASNFLGLAQLRLKKGDTAEALQLLHRMQLLADPPFDNLMPAADLLTRFHRTAEAEEFLKARLAAAPWDAQARLQLHQNPGLLVADSDVPYGVRVEAAQSGARGGGGELALLARGSITAAEAERPYYYQARLAAARNTGDARTRERLLLNAVAVRPDADTPMQALFDAAYDAKHYELAREAANRCGAATDPATARLMAAVYERFEETMAAEARLREIKAEGEIEALRARAKVREQNAARRPEVTAGVEQNRIVRPRIEK